MRLHSAGFWILCLSSCASMFGCGSSEPSPTASAPINSEVAMAPDMASETAPDAIEDPAAEPAMEMSPTETPSEPTNEMTAESEMAAMAMESPEVMTGENPDMAMEMAANMSDPAMAPDPLAAGMEAMSPEMMEESAANPRGPRIGMEGELLGPDSSQAAAEPEPEPEPLPSDYLAQSKLAFAAGMEQRAFDLLLAHLVAEPELAASSRSYEMVGWSNATKRPTWGLRVGVGINNAAVKHSGNMHPVRSDMKEPKEEPRKRNTGGGPGAEGPDLQAMGSGDGMGMGMPAAVSGDPSGEIEQHVGLVGEIALDLFAENFSNGDFGTVFANVSAVEPEPAKTTGRGHEAAPGEMAGEMLEAAGASEAMENMSADGSEGLMAGNPAAAGGGIAGGLGFSDGPPRVRPGLVYLGVNRPKELLEKAKQAGLDAFMQIDVSVTKNEVNGWVYNESSVRWVLVSTGRPIGRASKKINNKSVYQAMESRKLDPVEMVREDLVGAFKGGMDDLRLKPMPSLTPEMVKARVGSLIMSPPENPLEALAEVRMYASQGLLTDEQVALAFDLMMGDDGLILSNGPMEQRVELIEPSTPKLTRGNF
ncbi:hypothetical protein Poly24_28780 [Rosistilla carotiformis]|uniref:Uncharacterized protein n=1 Tax=Rosistilla carotiformis TaxID=2528017 RepID=A0A518JUE8_9BACT|nr:hypothetical protein [Rosistilla carotiformis]QDV69163.1 hypothetical protein Poly24_28780 [Rosistilla carotiformis]